MTNKDQGNSRERASREVLENLGYTVVRSKNTKSVPDLICFKNGVVLAVEVKSTVQKVWYPKRREREQYKAIKKWSEDNEVLVAYDLWSKGKQKWFRKSYYLSDVGRMYFKDNEVKN